MIKGENMSDRYRVVMVAAIVLMLVARWGRSNKASGVKTPVYYPTDGWRSSTPEQQGMDSATLADAMDFLHKREEDYKIHSLLVIRHGYIVLDAYFCPFARGTKHDVASVTKSFMSTLIGIAVDKGYIASVQQPVFDFFPDQTVVNVDANKKAMTVQHLLTMRSGLQCINDPTEVTLFQMMSSADWIQFTLNLPMSEKPGTRFVYCSSNVHLLSGIIRQTTGMSALDFARQHLFGPLGITDIAWPADPHENSHGWGDLHITPHDMAKLGYLYLCVGSWDGQQVLSSGYVKAATKAYSTAPRYGYLWWVKPKPSNAYYADGRGGQRIFVLPDQDMLVVTTGGGGRDQYGVLETLLTSYIIPAAESTIPLPPNRDGTALLKSRIDQVAMSVEAEAQPVPPLPQIARKISGKTYHITDPANAFGLCSFCLTFQQKDTAVLRFDILDPKNPTVEYLMGLDKVYRIAPGRFGLPAVAKGSWTSDNTFIVQLDEVGNINRWQFSFVFEDHGDRATVEAREQTGIGNVMFEARR